MRPPFSIIFMTTLFGLGQGLFLALYTGQLYSLFQLLPPPDGPSFYGMGSAVALVLMAIGMIASIFHLGTPSRGWRAATRWRTSWLSREVILLPIFIFLMVLYGGLHILDWNPPLFSLTEGIEVSLTFMIGALATLVCFALYLATGMIYASLRFLQEWATPLTVLNFLLLGGASGFTLVTAFAINSAPQLIGFFGIWAIIITLLALCSRGASLYRNSRIRHRSNPHSAIGIRHKHINQLHQGAMGGSFNTHEFFHGQTDPVLQKIKMGFLILTFPLPIVLLMVGIGFSATSWLIVAALIQYLGLLLERWFFFAEARHPQNLYYQNA
jgi:DMSO reductase anchor subunit